MTKLIATKCKDSWHVVVIKSYCVSTLEDVNKLIEDYGLNKNKSHVTKDSKYSIEKIVIED